MPALLAYTYAMVPNPDEKPRMIPAYVVLSGNEEGDTKLVSDNAHRAIDRFPWVTILPWLAPQTKEMHENVAIIPWTDRQWAFFTEDEIALTHITLTDPKLLKELSWLGPWRPFDQLIIIGLPRNILQKVK